MDLKMQWTALGLMALALVVAVGVGMARNTGMDQTSVSLADFRAVNQERLGYAITMTHYVDRTRDMNGRWSWQERLGHRIAIAHWVDRARGVTQEAMGWQIVAAHMMSRPGGTGRMAAAEALDHVRGLRQEQLGVAYMLSRHGGAAG
jgi:hypothetical protein